MPRHSHQDALSESAFQKLWDAAKRLPDVDARYGPEAEWVIVGLGRLGMRKGELLHCREAWIDWERDQINIPSFDECSCAYCKKRARQVAEHNDVSVDEALSEYWNPKTSAAQRAIPFDFNDEINDAVARYFMFDDGYPGSAISINRRVRRAADTANLPGNVYPHSLRATAASWHAYRGLPPIALQNLMGWTNLATAQKYLRLSGSATADALRKAHRGD